MFRPGKLKHSTLYVFKNNNYHKTIISFLNRTVKTGKDKK